MSALERIARSCLLGWNITLGKTADARAIQRFLDMIRPLETEHALIRLGGELDGGYLIPDDLEGINVCFSPGVSTIATFEEDLAARGIKCFLADASVSAPPVQNALFDFEPKYLGPVTGGQHISLGDWIDLKAPDQTDFILQMDIESAEYGVLLSTNRETLRKFRIMTIEFHRISSIYDRVGLDLISLAFAKVLQDFDVVHIHPNNRIQPVRYKQFEAPPLLEFTFLRKDRITRRRPATKFPHLLDRANVATRPEVALPRCWYDDRMVKDASRGRIDDDLSYYARYAWTELKSGLRISLNSDKRHLGERIARGIKSGAISRESIFTAAIRRDGAGSQVLSRLSVEAAARDLGLEYAHTPFESIAHAEGDPAAWRDRCETAFALGDGRRMARDVDLPRVGLIEFASRRTLWGTPHLIAIPHMYFYCDRAPDIYARVVPQKAASDTDRGPLKIAAHVRRGDVSTNAASHRYTSSKVVLASLQMLARLLENAGLAFEITVYSNGERNEFADFTDKGYRVELDLGALETFEYLCNADILLTAKSTFSYVAGLYTNGIVLYETFDRSPMSSWVLRDRNGTFSEDRVVTLLKARS